MDSTWQFITNHKTGFIVGSIVTLLVVGLVVGLTTWLVLAGSSTSSSSSSTSSTSSSSESSSSSEEVTPLDLEGGEFLTNNLILTKYNFSGVQQYEIEIVVENATYIDTGDIIDGIFVGSFNRNITSSYYLGLLSDFIKANRSGK
jgi:hypothetical protein